VNKGLPSGGLRFGRELLAAGLSAALVLLAGCGPVKLVANTNIPPPLVMKVPVGVALFIPTEFSSYVHKEERWSTKWQIELGQAQTDGITRLMNAMFERVVTVDSVNAGTQVPGGVAAILEPSIVTVLCGEHQVSRECLYAGRQARRFVGLHRLRHVAVARLVERSAVACGHSAGDARCWREARSGVSRASRDARVDAWRGDG
jgi:hypothetical protein